MVYEGSILAIKTFSFFFMPATSSSHAILHCLEADLATSAASVPTLVVNHVRPREEVPIGGARHEAGDGDAVSLSCWAERP